MLTFVDESGDPGLKFDKGSSSKFVITAVHFRDPLEAERCSQAIDELRLGLKLSPHKEFHFANDKPTLKSEFLRRVVQFDFVYCAYVLDKRLLTDPNFKRKDHLYKHAVQMAFESMEALWVDTTIIFDRCGGREFTQELKNYIRKQFKERQQEDGRVRIKEIKSAESHKDNLLQLADMACGAVNRSYLSKDDAWSYRNIIRKKEHQVQIWPQQ